MKPEHWRAWLRGASAMGLQPREFWRLSFAEWRALTEAPRAQMLSRAELDALSTRFPDIMHD
jgi:hypothetical protein